MVTQMQEIYLQKRITMAMFPLLDQEHVMMKQKEWEKPCVMFIIKNITSQ